MAMDLEQKIFNKYLWGICLSLETKTVLVTVKAYPNPSRKYTETVCCAGIDIDTKKWIRLYPIPYRDLDESQKFKKYNITSKIN